MQDQRRSVVACGSGHSRPGVGQVLLPLNTARGPCSRPVCCSCRFLPARQHRHGAQHSSRRQQPSRRRRASSIRTVALVSVEFNPALLLGLGIMGSGLLLYQLRQTKTAISRDTDIFISCICLCSGGILVFQGWRLDPLLLLCQLFTTTVALNYGWEALNARTNAPAQPDQQARAADPRSRGSQQRDNQAYEYEEGRAYELPPPAAQAGRYADWAGRDDSVRWRDDSAWQPASARQEAEQAEWQGSYARSDSRAGRSRDSQGSYAPEPAYASYDEQSSRETRRSRDEGRDQNAAYTSRQADSRSSSRDSSNAGRAEGRWEPGRWKGGSWSSAMDSENGEGDDWDLYS